MLFCCHIERTYSSSSSSSSISINGKPIHRRKRTQTQCEDEINRKMFTNRTLACLAQREHSVPIYTSLLAAQSDALLCTRILTHNDVRMLCFCFFASHLKCTWIAHRFKPFLFQCYLDTAMAWSSYI